MHALFMLWPTSFLWRKISSLGSKNSSLFRGLLFVGGCEKDFKVHPLPGNSTMAQIRTNKEEKTGKYKSKSRLFAPVFATIFSKIMIFI